MAEKYSSGSRWSALWRAAKIKGVGLLVGVGLSVTVGLVLLDPRNPVGQNLVAYSYDQPFQYRGFSTNTLTNAVLVFLDEPSHDELKQPLNTSWNRSFHTQLLKRLTHDGAKAVVFDLVFTNPTAPCSDSDPAKTDQELADAMRENGNVVLADDWVNGGYDGNGKVLGGVFSTIYPIFDEAAVDVGSDALNPEGGEEVRQYRPGPPGPAEKYNSEALAAAVLLNQDFLHRRFETNAIKNVGSFASKVMARADPVSTFVCSKLDKPTFEDLTEYERTKKIPATLESNLLNSLDDIIAGPVIYDPSRFASVKLNTNNGTPKFLEKFLTNDTRFKLAAKMNTPFNRKLLEDAYPKDLRITEDYPTFYLNYYCPETMFKTVSFYRAVAPLGSSNAVKDGFFKDKVVFVGERIQTKNQDTRKDEYSTPFSYLKNFKFMCGVAIHATAFLNLIDGTGLHRLSLPTEEAIVVLIGVLFGAGLVFVQPSTAAIVGVAVLFPLYLTNYIAFRDYHYWFPWIIPIVFQIPLAMASAVVINSVQLYIQKKEVEQSLKLYLPARLVKKFAADPTLLQPGAKKQMLTILFSDIAGFTTITEGMDPDQLAQLMNAYFQSSVDDCIHHTEGTIVKYIGDAIFAFWNAPDPQDDHNFRAADAALRFRDQDKHEFNGKKVVTRIGLHTGEANVGNFGSTTRVDYTAFGENINLTSRMEGLNKYLGTRVLMTGDTYQGIGLRLVTRYLGLFRLKGFEKAVDVYELMDRAENGEKTYELRKRFEEARELFVKKDFAAAEAGFRRVLEVSPQDGPSNFYLEQIEYCHSHPLPDDWKGDITLKEK